MVKSKVRNKRMQKEGCKNIPRTIGCRHNERRTIIKGIKH